MFALMLCFGTRASAQSSSVGPAQLTESTWIGGPASEAELDAMDAALAELADDSSMSGWDATWQLLMAVSYGGLGVATVLEADRAVPVVFSGSMMIVIGGASLGRAGYMLGGPSTSAAERYARFKTLRGQAPLSKRALLVFEGELYAQAESSHRSRPWMQALGVGWMIAGVLGLSVSLAALDGSARLFGGLMGGAAIVDGVSALIKNIPESSVEQRWRAYHSAHIQARSTGAPRVRLAPYASSTGAGLALNVQL